MAVRFDDQYEPDPDELWDQAFDEQMRERFVGGPVDTLYFLLDALDHEHRERVIDRLREVLDFFAPEPRFTPTPNALDILQALAESPTTMVQNDLVAATQISRRTISPILKRLVSVGLVHYPYGPNKGATITEKGRRYLP